MLETISCGHYRHVASVAELVASKCMLADSLGWTVLSAANAVGGTADELRERLLQTPLVGFQLGEDAFIRDILDAVDLKERDNLEAAYSRLQACFPPGDWVLSAFCQIDRMLLGHRNSDTHEYEEVPERQTPEQMQYLTNVSGVIAAAARRLELESEIQPRALTIPTLYVADESAVWAVRMKLMSIALLGNRWKDSISCEQPDEATLQAWLTLVENATAFVLRNGYLEQLEATRPIVIRESYASMAAALERHLDLRAWLEVLIASARWAGVRAPKLKEVVETDIYEPISIEARQFATEIDAIIVATRAKVGATKTETMLEGQDRFDGFGRSGTEPAHAILQRPTTPLAETGGNGPMFEFFIVLRGRGEAPVVMGKTKDTLTEAQYNVLRALIAAGPHGLSKDKLDKQAGKTDASQVLYRLVGEAGGGEGAGDPDWRKVILLPGRGGQGKGYRVKHPSRHTNPADAPTNTH